MKKIRLLIDDGLLLAREKPTGIGWYTLNLLEELPKLGVEVKRIHYKDLFCSLPAPVKRLIYLAFSRKNRVRDDVDVIHYTNYYVSPGKHRAATVSTIHDLTSYHFPETLPSGYRRYNRWAIACAVKYADLVLTPSQAIKRELLETFPNMREDRIQVVFQDIRDVFFQPYQGEFPREHFLYVGVLEKRKNLEFLIRAFGEFNKDHAESRLVLIGKRGFGSDDIAQTIAQTRNVIHHSYMPDDRLLEMYRKAHAVIMPSVYEGFGRPVVEAMAMGLPVIASDIPTNRELFDRHGRIALFGLSKTEELQSLFAKAYTAPAERIDYGDLTMYRTTEVARRHMDAYLSLL